MKMCYTQTGHFGNFFLAKMYILFRVYVTAAEIIEGVFNGKNSVIPRL